MLPYSSGTSGIPKGVMLTHRNLVANICQMRGASAMVNEGDRVIGVLPFFHIYGMVVIMGTALVEGATIVSMPRFELESFLKVLQDHRITYANIVPPILLALAKHPMVANYDLSALRTLFSGAAPLGAELATRRRAAARHAACARAMASPKRARSRTSIPSRATASSRRASVRRRPTRCAASSIPSPNRTCRPASAASSGCTDRRS